METIETTVYRKPTNSNIFLKRRTFAPDARKGGTLKTLIKCVYFACSYDIYLEQELNRLKFVFETHSNVPKLVIFQLINKTQVNLFNSTSTTESTDTTDVKSDLLVVPYAGYESNKLTE